MRDLDDLARLEGSSGGPPPDGPLGRHDEICAHTPETLASRRHDMQTLPAPAGVPRLVWLLACGTATLTSVASVGRPVCQMDRRWRAPFEQGSSLSRGRTAFYTVLRRGYGAGLRWYPSWQSQYVRPACMQPTVMLLLHERACHIGLGSRPGIRWTAGLELLTSHRTDDAERGDTAAWRHGDEPCPSHQ